MIVLGKVLSYWCKTIQFRAYSLPKDIYDLLVKLLTKYFEFKNLDIWKEYKKELLQGIANTIFKILVEEVYGADNREDLMCFGVKKCSLTAGDSVILYTKLLHPQEEREVEIWVYAYYCKIGAIGTIIIGKDEYKVDYCEAF